MSHTMTHIAANEPKSWLDKLAYALLREPQDRAHLLQILRDACQRKLLDADTLAMVEGVIRYSELRVRDIMMPRSQIIAISNTASYQEIIDTIQNNAHSRYPVYEDSIDNIIGILHAKELVLDSEQAQEFNISDKLRPATFIPESKYLNILLTDFKRKKNHMAVVVDEYGGVSGFVTIEDVIEQIVGDIEDEFDNNDEDFIKKHENGRFIIKGQLPINEFNNYFKKSYHDENYDTLAGMIMRACDHVPNIGETIHIGVDSFKILNADNRRIKLIEYKLKEI